MDSIKSNLETLSDSKGVNNYSSWKFKLNLALKSKGLFDVASGVKLKPAGAESDASVQSWMKSDIEAQTLIGLNVSSNIAVKICNCTSASQMLNKLDLLYGKMSDVTKEGLQRSFFSYTYDSNMSVIDNCLKIQQLAEDLTAGGDEVKEGWVMTRILSALPPKLHHFRSAWDNVSATDKNISTLLERLRLEDDRLNQTTECQTSKSHNAFFSQKNVDKKVICFKCNMTGHVKKFCRNKPSEKYLAYCKENYACSICHLKGHFAKSCPKKKALITPSIDPKTVSSDSKCQNWYQDCGASQHMTSHKNLLTNYVKLNESKLIVIGDGTTLEGVGVGDADLEAFNGNYWEKISLKDVLHVPDMPFNLFSVTQILDKGYVLSADANKSVFKSSDGKDTVAIAQREGDLFKMMFHNDQPVKCFVSTSLKVWHERLAHQNVRYVKDFLKNNHIDYIDDWDNFVCPGCVYGKQHNVSHPLNTKVAENVLDTIHVDLCEMNIRSLGGAKYFLLLKDDYSHYRTVYFLKSKDETFSKLEAFIKLVENQFGKTIKCLRSDNGTEIKNKDTKKLLESLGVFHTNSVAYTPQQNGRIEREMRTVVEAARTVIHANNMNENLWAEAVNYSVFTINQTGKSTVKGSSPADLWFGRKIDVTKLRSFGCTAYVHIPDHKRFKTEKKSKRGRFVGYDIHSSAYRVYLEDEDDVESSVNVIFDEKCSFDQQISVSCSSNVSDSQESHEDRSEFDASARQDQLLEPEQQAENVDIQNEDLDQEIEVNNLEDQHQNIEVNIEAVQDDHNYGAQAQNIGNDQPVRNLRDRNRIQIPLRLHDYEIDHEMGLIHNAVNYVENDISYEPSSYDEVMKLPVNERQKWLDAMNNEMQAPNENNTWTEIPKPKNVNVVSCKWVFKEKKDGNKSIYKARLVARGFQQDEKFNFEDTYAPVAKLQTLRILLAVSLHKKLDIQQMDVVCAFLNGDIDETVYMQKPDGFQSDSNSVLRLNKSLYGLKKSPKYWNNKLNDFLLKQGYQRSAYDLCLYVKNGTYILVYVDDILLFSDDQIEIKWLKEHFNENFKMKDLGNISKFLGMNITQEKDKIIINQTEYIKLILKKFNMDQCKPVTVPIEPNFIYSGDYDSKYEAKCRSLIGALLYVSLCSRPDIMVSVSILARYQHIANECLWIALKRVLRYLQGTINLSLEFPGDNQAVDIEAYADADWAGDVATRKSTSGFVIKLFGCLILWQSRRQSSVSLSTAEAEYISASEACSELIWTLNIIDELGIQVTKPVTLHEDNQAAIKMAAGQSKRCKHIDIRYHFIRSKIEEKIIQLKYVDSNNQLADIFTKPLHYPKLMNIRTRLGIK
ncbi:hypothetical protein M8J77_007947 [Diaphorina citri]|nr:hypothetical protein M8J77_007947 [Diaphorina citri]